MKFSVLQNIAVLHLWFEAVAGDNVIIRANRLPTPSPIQSGAITDCAFWAMAIAGDTCEKFAGDHGITLQNLYNLNPQLKGDCQHNLFAGYYYCTSFIQMPNLGLGPPRSTNWASPQPTAASPASLATTAASLNVPSLDPTMVPGNFCKNDAECASTSCAKGAKATCRVAIGVCSCPLEGVHNTADPAKLGAGNANGADPITATINMAAVPTMCGELTTMPNAADCAHYFVDQHDAGNQAAIDGWCNLFLRGVPTTCDRSLRNYGPIASVFGSIPDTRTSGLGSFMTPFYVACGENKMWRSQTVGMMCDEFSRGCSCALARSIATATATH